MSRAVVAAVATLVAGGIAAGLVLAFGSSSSARWVLDDLGTLPGYTECLPVAMNDGGQIVGSCNRGVVQSGFLWQGGKMVGLGQGVVPTALNSRGQVVGRGPKRAFLWQHGRITWLGPSGSRSSAEAINDHGQVAGVVWRRDGGHVVLWQGVKAIELGVLGEPSAINARGEVVGVGTGADPHAGEAFLWQSGKTIDLGPFNLNSESIAVNDAGQVVASGADGAFLWQNGKFVYFGGGLGDGLAIDDRGQILLGAGFGSDKHNDAYLWERGKLTLLPHFGRHRATFASTMNSRGQVIGWSLLSIGRPLPFVWQKGQKMVALPTLKAGSGAPYTYAAAINDGGEIAGYGYVLVNGHTQQHVVLWERH